jgi:hypothetical protein
MPSEALQWARGVSGRQPTCEWRKPPLDERCNAYEPEYGGPKKQPLTGADESRNGECEGEYWDTMDERPSRVRHLKCANGTVQVSHMPRGAV